MNTLMGTHSRRRILVAAAIIAALGAAVVILCAQRHPVIRHLHPLAPIYSYRNVKTVKRLGLPIYRGCVNRPYTRSWARHHAGAELRGDSRTFRFETDDSFQTVVAWYKRNLSAPPFKFNEPKFTGTWGDWEASYSVGEGTSPVVVRVNLFDGVTHIFYYVQAEALDSDNDFSSR